MSAAVLVVVWFAIAACAFTAGLVGIANTRRRLDGLPGHSARKHDEARVSVS